MPKIDHDSDLLEQIQEDERADELQRARDLTNSVDVTGCDEAHYP